MFTPVARLASIWTVLAFAAAEDYETGQIDIKSAYLNGELTSDEVIFMKQAPGYEVDGCEKGAKVYQLKKSLYGDEHPRALLPLTHDFAIFHHFTSSSCTHLP